MDGGCLEWHDWRVPWPGPHDERLEDLLQSIVVIAITEMAPSLSGQLLLFSRRRGAAGSALVVIELRVRRVDDPQAPLLNSKTVVDVAECDPEIFVETPQRLE